MPVAMFVVMSMTIMAIVIFISLTNRLTRPIAIHPDMTMPMPHPITRDPHILVIRESKRYAWSVIEIVAVSGLRWDGNKAG